MSVTANLKKTYYYYKKNGIIDTYYALRERLYARTSPLYMAGYDYVPVPEEELQRQREYVWEYEPKISILVPMYETKPEFARAMIDSVLAQTYSNWELILADASGTDVVKNIVCDVAADLKEMNIPVVVSGLKEARMADEPETYKEDMCIQYVRIAENRGISENTNEAMCYATGEYIGLLDHDDLLTPDALFEMAAMIEKAKKDGKSVAFVFSDEDKCDTNAQKYYEPHIKSGFNLDLLFSNNYICHFLIMKAELMKKVGFRKEYDGAQDYDLVLRAFLQKEPSDEILHVNKILYHWRCHESSTAANPQSKLYAYEAGKRAVESALEEYLVAMHGRRSVRVSTTSTKGKNGTLLVGNKLIYVNGVPICVLHTKHNGFYRVQYGKGAAGDIFKVRKDVGIVAGPVIKRNKITGGICEKDGTFPYAGLPADFSGYMHKMELQQECECVDADNYMVRDELFDVVRVIDDKDEKIKLDLIKGKGEYKILYDPYFDADRYDWYGFT